MPPLIIQLRNVLVSLRLTVFLLALSIVLVFWATLDQVHLGVWAVQQKFFHSFLVFARVGDLRVPVYPGGYTIGGLLLVNLLCAHAYRFRRGWGKAGIWTAHAGLILLLVGELVSGYCGHMKSIDSGRDRSGRFAFLRLGIDWRLWLDDRRRGRRGLGTVLREHIE